ncbi:hypothetical protein ACFPYJ_01580 [Paenibacillus solisilvae]|uniref:Uncharacterized protein n=1 Tax=Paenibacillus solisilvae TaxID=2486751 RepID=A0ABW0VQH9_9BACL
MKKFVKEVLTDTLHDVREHVRESENTRMAKAFYDGYDKATDICVGIITKKIEELFSKINSDSSLSKQEQFMLLKLNELKSETEKELRDFWSGNE